jgi:hypothetical protein
MILIDAEKMAPGLRQIVKIYCAQYPVYSVSIHMGVVSAGQHSEDRLFAHVCLGSFIGLDDFN